MLLQQRLAGLGVSAVELERIGAEARSEMEEAAELAAAAPWPDTAHAYADVQDVGAPSCPD